MSSPRFDPSMVPGMRKRYVQLNPVNSSSGGSYSFSSGLPLVKFDIASSDRPQYIDGRELRITGNITYRTSAGVEYTLAGNNFVDGAAGAFASAIDTLTVSSKFLNTTLERINNYSRMVPSVITGVHSQEDTSVSLSHGGLHQQTVPMTKYNVCCYDFYNTERRLTGTGAQGIMGKSFSTPLYAGIFHSGEDIDVSRNGTSGLVIEILLKSSVNSLFGSVINNTGTITLNNLVLTVPVYEMDAAMPPPQVSQFNFNSWSSMFQTINSSNSTVAFTPGLGRVASWFCNFINSNELGNDNFNYQRMGLVAELHDTRYTRNGQLYPIDFRLDTVEQSNDNAQVRNGISSNIVHNRVGQLRNYLEAVRTDRYNKVSRTSCAFNTWSSGVRNRAQTSNNGGLVPGTAEGLGCLLDAYGSGVDYSQSVWAMELVYSGTNRLNRTNAAGAVANAPVADNLDGTAATSQGVFIYFLNKNTLLLSPNGIDIQR